MSAQKDAEARPAHTVPGRASVAWEHAVDQWRYLRMWKARGKLASKWWVPRVGDRVHYHGKGCWLVYGVSVRRGEVTLGRPGVVALEHCDPVPPGELAEFYSTNALTAGRRVAPILPATEHEKPVDLSDHGVFTVDGQVVDSPPESEGSHGTEEG